MLQSNIAWHALPTKALFPPRATRHRPRRSRRISECRVVTPLSLGLKVETHLTTNAVLTHQQPASWEQKPTLPLKYSSRVSAPLRLSPPHLRPPLDVHARSTAYRVSSTMSSDERRRLDTPHVVLLAFPFGTHASPLFFLARTLAAAAPGATFSFINSARSNASLARSAAAAVPAPANIRIYDVSDGCPEGYKLPTDDPEEEVRLFLRVTPGNFWAAMVAAERDRGLKVSCMVSDAFLSFVGRMAAEMGVPWVALWTGGPASLAAHLYTDLLRVKVGTGEPGKLPLNLIR